MCTWSSQEQVCTWSSQVWRQGLGYQLLLITSNSPMIGAVLFMVFYFEAVYISKRDVTSEYLVFISTLLFVLMHALLHGVERKVLSCVFIYTSTIAKYH